MKYLEDNPEFYKYEPPIKKIWEQVHVQATAHTQRLEVDPVLDKVRPNEPQMSKDYRQENRRLITKADISRFVTKCQRIFEASGIKLVPESLSEVMAKWLESEPFYYLGQYSELEEYMYRVVLPEAIEDPNALLVVWPYSAYSEEPPAYPMQLGGHPANEQVPIDVKIIPSSKVVVITENVFGWLAGRWQVDENTWHNYYYFADETFYYRVYPVKDGSGIKYESEVWYYHNIQDLPLNILPGFLSKYKSAYYNESIMHGYFEYADEFKARFTDNQAINVQHAYPKVIMRRLPCQEKNCNNGKIKTVGKTGNIKHEDCTTCKGSGYMNDPGPYGVLIDENVQLSEGAVATDAYRYVVPPTEIIKSSYENAFDILDRGKRQVGLDLLLNLDESGKAKNYRLEDLQDFLSSVSASFFDAIEMKLWFIECLLQPDPDKRKRPAIQRVRVFKLKDVETLKQDFDNALPFDRLETALELIRTKYRGEDDLIKMYEVAFRYCPDLLLSDEELRLRIANGEITPERLRKKDYAIIAIKEVMNRNKNFQQMTYEKIIEQAAPIVEASRELPVFAPLFE